MRGWARGAGWTDRAGGAWPTVLVGLAVLVTVVLGLGACGSGGGDDGAGSGGTPSGSAPLIVTQPLSQALASGATATLTVVASGTAPLAYQWRLDGVAIAGATAASYGASAAGSYTVLVSNAYGTVSSDAASVALTSGGAVWALDTGRYAPDLADTSGYLVLNIALDTLVASSASSRLTVGAAAEGVTPVMLDGAVAITLTRDAFGLSIRSTLAGDTHVAYRLSGSAGTSVTVHSANAYRVVLADAAIASPDGPALNLQSKQTAYLQLEGTNRLSDSATWSGRTGDDGKAMDLKATLFAEGPVVIAGSGLLTVQATSKHALASDRHVRLRSGSLVLSAAAKDGLRANHAFVMDGGALAIATPAGKGIKVEGKEDATQPLGFIALNDGTLDIVSHDKAITASWESDEDGDTATLADDPDPRVTINGGTITVTTTGTPYEDRNLADGDDSLSPEGIEAKSVLTVNGGLIVVRSTDDALNAGTAIVINGGRVYARSSANDGIDSNGTLSITGGIVVADGANGAEGGFDCDNNRFSVTGGLFVGTGGRNSNVTASASSQNTVAVRNVSAGLWVLRDDGGNAVFAFTVPEASTAMVLGSPRIATGSRYTVVTGGTLAAAGEDFHGLVLEPGLHSGGTAGSSFTVSGRVSSL